MPPTFVYLLFFVVWLALACIVWTAGGVMLLSPRTRRLSRPLCLAMAGTFPFVLVYQVLAAPVVAIVLIVGWALWKLLEPGSSSMTQNPVVIAVSIGVVFFSFALMLTASLAGFYDGWFIGWKCGGGHKFRYALSEAPTLKRLRSCLRVLRSRRTAKKLLG
jgi:hypothetical protein